jgi:fructose-bisphosphate aldolase class II
MALIHPTDLLQHAYRHRYAVATLGVANLESLHGILAAAEDLRAPVMLGFTEGDRTPGEFESLLAAAVLAAKRAPIPVALHLEGARDQDALVRGIRLGCQSIRFDASADDFPENRARTRQLAESARDCGVLLEGTLAGNAPAKGKFLQVTAAEAGAFASATGINSLFLRVDAQDRRLPAMDMQRLARINQVAGLPLAMDADSGLREDQLPRLIASGVARVACAASLHEAAMVSVLEWSDRPAHIDFARLRQALLESVRAEAARLILLFGGAGRAAEVLQRCRPWREVEHVILFNSSEDEAGTEEIIAAGRAVLAAIPGVRQVETGQAVAENAPYRHAWLIRFAAEPVIAAYDRHPDHVAYAGGQFRPIAAERLKVDYEIR